MGIDIDHIVELGTQVAQHGAIRTAELMADEFFDYVIGIAILVYAKNPT